MNAKDRDIYKLKMYANELGLKVYTKKYTRHTGQAEYIEGSCITLFLSKRSTKTEIILSLLHELGHHLDWLKNKKKDADLDKALDLLANGSMTGDRSDIPKKYRKKILQVERSGVKYMSVIHSRLGLQIPLRIVKQQEKMDLADYEFLYHQGRFATGNEINKVYSKINKRKHGKRNKFRY
jgi:hypothetical protein